MLRAMLRTMLRTSGIAIAAFFLLTSIGLSQDNRFDVSLGGGPVIPNHPAGNGTTLTPTKSGAVLVTGRYRFSERSSIEINYGHTSDSQIYSTPPLTYRIQNTISEYSGAYVFSFHQPARFEPFVFAGAGAVTFYPRYGANTVNDVLTNIPASQQTKPAFVYGGGFDYGIFSHVPYVRRSSLTNHLALRFQYRGLLYKAPDFKVQNLFTGARGHMAEPNIGIVVKF
jgi:outer membrane immunogenic protein